MKTVHKQFFLSSRNATTNDAARPSICILLLCSVSPVYIELASTGKRTTPFDGHVWNTWPVLETCGNFCCWPDCTNVNGRLNVNPSSGTDFLSSRTAHQKDKERSWFSHGTVGLFSNRILCLLLLTLEWLFPMNDTDRHRQFRFRPACILRTYTGGWRTKYKKCCEVFEALLLRNLLVWVAARTGSRTIISCDRATSGPPDGQLFVICSARLIKSEWLQMTSVQEEPMM